MISHWQDFKDVLGPTELPAQRERSARLAAVPGLGRHTPVLKRATMSRPDVTRHRP